MLICDFIWVLSVLYIFLSELSEIFNTVRQGGICNLGTLSTLWNEYLGLWNTIDWVSMITAFWLIGQFITWWTCCLALSGQFEDIMKLETVTMSSSHAFASSAERAQHIAQLENF